MVWLPARPSPMAAPTAPPPSARPPPTMAPAIRTASAIEASAMSASPFVFGWVQRRVGPDGSGVWCRRPVSGSVVRRHRRVEVEDGEQGEDEGLDGPDGHVEQLPDQREGHGEEGAE